MAISNIPLLTSGKLYLNTDVDETKVDVTAVSTVIYELELDNTANAAAASFVKMWNTNTVTVGTTAPDDIHRIPAATKITVVYPGGTTFGTALTIAAVTTAGTAGVTGPTSAVIVKIVYV